MGVSQEQKFSVPWVLGALLWGFWVVLQTSSVSDIAAIFILSVGGVLTLDSNWVRGLPEMPLLLFSKWEFFTTELREL